MISNLDPILQFRRLKPQSTKEKTHHDFISKVKTCHKNRSKTQLEGLSRHYRRGECHHFNSDKSTVKQRSKCNHYWKGPKPHLTVQKKVRYRHMEVGAAEFVNGPIVYHSRECYEHGNMKRSVPLILNTLHHED